MPLVVEGETVYCVHDGIRILGLKHWKVPSAFSSRCKAVGFPQDRERNVPGPKKGGHRCYKLWSKDCFESLLAELRARKERKGYRRDLKEEARRLSIARLPVSRKEQARQAGLRAGTWDSWVWLARKRGLEIPTPPRSNKRRLTALERFRENPVVILRVSKCGIRSKCLIMTGTYLSAIGADKGDLLNVSLSPDGTTLMIRKQEAEQALESAS